MEDTKEYEQETISSQKSDITDCADNVLMQLAMIIKSTCPVLSGNMVGNVSFNQTDVGNGFVKITAPSYDMKAWKKTKAIRLDGKWDYAIWVNKYGAFGYSHPSSMGWVNRAIHNSVDTIASVYNANIIYDGV